MLKRQDKPANISWPGIVSDTDWSGTRFYSCITSFSRTIKFEKQLSDEEVAMLTEAMRETKPGWGPLFSDSPLKREDGYEYRFTCEHDSSG